jgi:hypothetical protein
MPSTYSDLITDVLVEFESDAGKLSGLADEKIQYWINLAQREICKRTQVRGQRNIVLTPNSEDYAIPSNIRNIYAADRLEGSRRRPIEVVSLDRLLEMRQKDGISIHSSYYRPLCLAMWMKDATRFIRVYPMVQTKKTITLYTHQRHNPRDYADNELTEEIQLTSEYDETIKWFLRGKIYHELGQVPNEAAAMQMFAGDLKNVSINESQPVMMKMTYR